ncbi:MAG TPA: FCD domain-containing protein [Solirubrobacteraceae bacterium]|jgi:GntR family transcriptional repressor for pyruvate dehydrogenase complex|nr:FCD domain-containing protein [Solirubrobacteraceae bacterium]
MPAAGEQRREPVYATVQAKLREFVRQSKLEPGDRLPTERELAQQLAVSRTSLRQALTALRVEGLIDVRHGDGIYLLRSADDVVPPIAAELGAAHPNLPALGEVRNALEALAAESAAMRRTDDDLAAMVSSLRLMEQEIADGKPGLRGDRTFHAAVLCAAQNEVLSKLLGAISDGSERIARASLSRPGQPERSLAAHRLILDAIVARETDLAWRLMYDHLELTGEFSAA